MASRTQWTWVWVNSGSWWWTGRPGVLRLMGSQRVGRDWATELNWITLLTIFFDVFFFFFKIVSSRMSLFWVFFSIFFYFFLALFYVWVSNFICMWLLGVFPQLTDTLLILNICQILFSVFQVDSFYWYGFNFTDFCICSIQFAVNCILYFAVCTIHFAHLRLSSVSSAQEAGLCLWSRTASQGSKWWQLSLTSHLSLPDSQILKTVFSHIFPFLFVSGGRINWSLLFHLGCKWKSLIYFFMWLCQFDYSQTICRFIFNYK